MSAASIGNSVHLERKTTTITHATLPSRQLRTTTSEGGRHDGDGEEEDTRWEDFVRPTNVCKDIDNSSRNTALDTCSVTEFFCSAAGKSSFELWFQYDIYTTAASDPAIDFVEERIFRDAAEALGIDDCLMRFDDEDNIRKRALRRRTESSGRNQGLSGRGEGITQQGQTRAQGLGHGHGVTSIETTPWDEVRPGGCDDPPAGFDPSECVAVQGIFTIHGHDDVSDIRGALLEHIEEQMNEDVFVKLPSIKKVVFVGPGKPAETEGDGEGEDGDTVFGTVSPPTTNNPPQFDTSATSPPPERSDAEDVDPPPSATDKLVETRPGPTSTDRSGATTMLVVAAAGLALIVLFAFLGISRLRKKRNNANNNSREIIEDGEYVFDVTDNSPPKSLAGKDSLALVPQRDLPNDMEEGRDLSANNLTVKLVGSLDKNISFVSESDEESGSDAEVGSSEEDEEEEDDSDARLMNTGLQAYPDTLPGRRTVAVGESLSLIQEVEEAETPEQTDVEDHNLDFEEALSAASYDTRSSARRVLQMT